MWVFNKDNATATVKRLWYVDESGYKKSWYALTGNSYLWHLKFLTVKDWIETSNFGKEYQFNAEYNGDIKESDKLTIDWVDYDVKGVSKQTGISFSRLVAILQKWSN